MNVAPMHHADISLSTRRRR